MKDVGGDLVLQRFQDFFFTPLGKPGRGKLGIPEVTVDALEGIIGKRAVQVLEIEGVVQCLAHLLILEFVPAQVRHESLHDAGGTQRVLDLRANHTAILGGREVIERCPMAGAIILVIIDIAGTHTLELDRPVAKERVGNRAEIVLANIDVDVLTPVVVTQFEADRTSCLEGSDLVGP